MTRPRTGIGAELVLLATVLATLAGTLTLVIVVHRRSAEPAKKSKPPAPVVASLPAPKVVPPAPEPAPEPEPRAEPAPAPPPPPEDPTPKALAPIAAAEAEQREEAIRADRKAEALEAARRAAEIEAERLSRREALARGQLDALHARASAIEGEVAAMTAERDVLAQRRDLAKHAAAQAMARPSSAILPHKGLNGTWRRPIAIECRNGQAILQPKGLAFGLLELSEGFGPSSNPFVSAVIRESVHLQGERGPDGAPVVPYIFFLIRPDGIRPYYEARARLESLSITFGYELVESDVPVDFPDLDDVSTWDGSAPSRKTATPLAQGRPASGFGRDEATTTRPNSRRGAAAGSRSGRSGTADEFVWTMPRLGMLGGPGSALRNRADEPGSLEPPAPEAEGSADRPKALHPPISPPVAGTAESPAGPTVDPTIGGSDASVIAEAPGGPESPADDPRTMPGSSTQGAGGAVPELDRSRVDAGTGEGVQPSARPAGGPPEVDRPAGRPDPGDAFVWPAKPGSGSGRPGSRPGPETEVEAEAAVSGIPSLPSAREIAERRQGIGRSPVLPTQPGSGEGQVAGGRVAERAGTGAGSPPGSATDATGSPGAGAGLASGGSGSQGQGQSDGASGRSLTAFASPGTIVDRPFELVVFCGPHGAAIHPGGYRVTAKALEARDGLLIEQMKGLVSEQRRDDPHTRIEPRVRFLVQPGGEETYRTARGQLWMSGLNWPSSLQVIGPDPVALLPSESW